MYKYLKEHQDISLEFTHLLYILEIDWYESVTKTQR